MFLFRRYRAIFLFVFLLLLIVFVRWGATHSIFEALVYGPLERLRGTVVNSLLPYGETEALKNRLAEEEETAQKLMCENAKLREQIARTALSEEAKRWESVAGVRFVTARVVGRQPGSWAGKVWVDRGSADGIKNGGVALDGAGLAGRVIKTQRTRSLVQLVTAPGAATSCRIQPSNARGILIGNGTGMLRIDFVASKYPVEKGNIVETSGLGGHYPPGIPVGKVTSVDSDTRQLTLPLEASVAADLEHLDFVSIAVE